MTNTYIIRGDIIHAGRIEVDADNPAEANKKAEAGEFTVHEEEGKNLDFVSDWCECCSDDGEMEIVDADSGQVRPMTKEENDA